MSQTQVEPQKRQIEVTDVFTRNLKATQPVILNEGGADSSKSYSLAQLFIYKFNNERDKSFLVCRKTLPHLRITAYRLIIELMKDYGYYGRLIHNKSERTLYNSANNNFMLFTSIDDPEKIKSAEFNYEWLEEANEFTWDDFINLRKCNRAKTSPDEPNTMYLSYNPVDEYGYINEKLKPQADVQVIHSTVDDNPFAQEADIAVLDGLESQDDTYYRIYRLGKYAKLKGRIYEIEIVTEFPECRETIYGVDYGFINPSVLIKLGIDMENMSLYLTELIHETHLTNSQFIDRMKEEISEEHRDREIYADAAEPDRIEEAYEAGFNIKPSFKGKKSVLDGIDLVNRFKLYTKIEYTKLVSEMRGYKRKVDKDGRVREEPVKFRDHCPDAVRYPVFTHLRERLLELEPAWTVTTKTKPIDVKPIEDDDVRQAAIKRIEDSGFLSLAMFAKNMSHSEEAMRAKLLAMGFEEHSQNRFVYGEALDRIPAVVGKEEERDDESWVV